jgi:hypothetical protein
LAQFKDKHEKTKKYIKNEKYGNMTFSFKNFDANRGSMAASDIQTPQLD